ncbi:hypothetical protein BT96DRAFT_191550 [Gymnopus androsaceus JB14]|uniref:F-box domain-containing protein n=1 Tax=Gymnopus androsaceus JB14 TaxID=1447944 RepID=A0A6A4IDK6_9AGAR|nr:hypothetical protein BT96DRAFT_191550 [Gymnopus androsaceus JB14]
MSIHIELPVELYEQIIDFALDSQERSKSIADILNFALVCRLWTQRSRYHLELSLDESRVKFQKLQRFTDLCNHPSCTLHYVGALSVSNTGNTRIGLERRPQDHKAANALFSRRFHSKGREAILESVFTQLKTLTIGYLGKFLTKLLKLADYKLIRVIYLFRMVDLERCVS